jgi:hypothetical protein
MKTNDHDYYIGVYAKNNQTVVLQASETRDGLNCEILDYFCQRITTKKRLNEHKYEFLTYLKNTYPLKYTKYKYIIVQ